MSPRRNNRYYTSIGRHQCLGSRSITRWLRPERQLLGDNIFKQFFITRTSVQYEGTINHWWRQPTRSLDSNMIIDDGLTLWIGRKGCTTSPIRCKKYTQFVVSVKHNNQLTINASGIDINQTTIKTSSLWYYTSVGAILIVAVKGNKIFIKYYSWNILHKTNK